MTLLLLILDIAVAILVTLATTIQVLYLESLRIRARELPSLEFFKATLEAKIGLETELGALTFSLVLAHPTTTTKSRLARVTTL